MNPFLLTILAFTFFSQKEGKEKKELHNNAETAFAQANYTAAKKAFGELFKKIDKPEEDWQNTIDIVVRYAEVHLLLKEYYEGEQLLLNLLKKNPPAEFTPRICVLLGRLYSFQEKAGQGYVQMRQAMMNIALEKWRPEERSFFHAVEYALNAYYENLLQKSKHFAATHLHNDACLAYEKILEGINNGFFPLAIDNPLIKKKVTFRLAESHFLAKNFEKTLTLASSFAKPKDEFDAEMLFLAALCYKEKREYEKALLCFQNYLISDHASLLFHYDNALFEVAQFYYRNDNMNRAKEYLEKLALQRNETATRPVLIGSLCLSRIYLQEKRYAEAELLLSDVQKKLKSDDPLYFEITFLHGELAFSQKEYQKAEHFFEMALEPSVAKGNWSKSALYKLALCYIRQQNSSCLKKGEEILEKFLKCEFDQEIAFALADLYVTQNDENKFRALMSEIQNHLTEAGKKEFLLLQSRFLTTYEEKDTLLQKVIACPNELSNTIHAKGLYYLALNHLEKSEKVEENKEFYLRKAIDSLEGAHVLLEKCDEEAASQVLRLEIQAHSLLKDQALALSLLHRLDQEGCFHEKLYLKALLLSQLNNPEYKEEAIRVFESILSLYPEEEYADDALFALATFHYKLGNYSISHDCFLQLIERYSHSVFAEVSYYWAAEALEKSGEPQEKCNLLRRQCFEKYPLSSKASDAYFKCYTLEQYLQGDENAISHIRSFPTLFPTSDLLAMSYFFIGYHETAYPIAKATLEKALDLFQKKSLMQEPYIHFHFKTMLEIALLDIRHSQNMTDALKMLLNLVSQLQELPASLKDGNPYPPIYEESEFALFQIYHNLKKETLAYEVLLSMLKHYSEAGITEGFYLSEVWKEQGILAYEAKDYTTALSCFGVAYECGEKYLTAEQRFFLELYQSDCYRALCDYDQAMRTLSHVINEESDSHLRLKAMYLRAEIYEMQGRSELSLRQLLALAKLEGKWAFEAKEKLRKVYGVSE